MKGVANTARDGEARYAVPWPAMHYQSHLDRFSMPRAHVHMHTLEDMANYIYLDAGRPYSLIDQRADFRHIQLDIIPSLLEAVQRVLGIAQGSPALGKQTYYRAEKRQSPRIYKIVKVETENNAEQPGERTHFENPKTRYRQADCSKNQVNKSIQCTSRYIWIKIPLKRSELRR